VIDGIKIYPRMGDPNGTDAIIHHSKDFKADVVFVMLDFFIMDSNILAQAQQQGIKIIPWIPIDQEPVPPAVLNNLKYAYKILTFSKFGQQALEKEGYASRLILEGLDTNIFKPMDRNECRRELGIPEDVFLFGMIGANKENPPRKGYQEALEAFALFAKDHSDARLFVHSQQINPGGGFPIHEYARYLGILDKIIYLDQYKASYGSDSQQVAKEINAFDVQLHPSMTEGFGMLIIESQACGIPPIINRCTSMPELVVENKTGWICETGKPWWRNLGGYSYFADVNSLHEKMEMAYTELKNPDKKKLIAERARKNILQNYSIDNIIRGDWIPFLENLQEEVLGKKEE
jgi:glycosyltransferase involved in cell wall biosynthesis